MPRPSSICGWWILQGWVATHACCKGKERAIPNWTMTGVHTSWRGLGEDVPVCTPYLCRCWRAQRLLRRRHPLKRSDRSRQDGRLEAWCWWARAVAIGHSKLSCWILPRLRNYPETLSPSNRSTWTHAVHLDCAFACRVSACER